MVLPVWLRIQTNERAGRYRKGNSCDGSGPNAQVQICKVIIYKLYLSSETWKKTHGGFHHLPDHIHTHRTTLHTSWILPMQPVFYIWLDLLYHLLTGFQSLLFTSHFHYTQYYHHLADKDETKLNINTYKIVCNTAATNKSLDICTLPF